METWTKVTEKSLEPRSFTRKKYMSGLETKGLVADFEQKFTLFVMEPSLEIAILFNPLD